MTMRPCASTPPVTGESWGSPSWRRVTSTIWWRGRMNSSSPSRSTLVFVAMVRGMSGPFLVSAGWRGAGPHHELGGQHVVPGPATDLRAGRGERARQLGGGDLALDCEVLADGGQGRPHPGRHRSVG